MDSEEYAPQLSFAQFAATSEASPVLMAGLKQVAAKEKHTAAEWISRLTQFGQQAA